MLYLPRTTFSVCVVIIALLILSGFRMVLFLKRRSELCDLTGRQLVQLFWVGLRLDGVIASRSFIALVLIVLLLPDSMLPVARPFLHIYIGVLYFVFFCAEIGGLYFFRYYDFRPNYLVFEHGLDPEVLKAVGKAYPVLRIFLLAAIGALFCERLVHETAALGQVNRATVLPWSWDRWGTLAWLVFIGFATRGTLDHRPLNPSFASVTTNRVANEIASCGIFNVLYEWSHRYKNDFTPLNSVMKLPAWDEAVKRLRAWLSDQGVFTDDSPNPLVRVAKKKKSAVSLNVVLVVMESFTARLTGCLGGYPGLSPHLDQLSKEGVLFERCYATGERTIQALEAAVSSFPPLPGVAAVKRPRARQGFVTLAHVLKERGYATSFLYGGQGIFDHMRAFFVANGFDSFIEEKDFLKPVFRSAWGVSDEDLFHRADTEFCRLHAAGHRFFATLLTVSLHSPWEYPAGRIAPLSQDTAVPEGFELAELNNFLYADYAIGKFIHEARKASYFEDTLFVFVGDHGVHLRGRDLIPVDEFRVPALFFCPAHLRPGRVGQVTSQIDIPTTIMGIVGGEYRNPFFGTDVIGGAERDRFAVVIYNKKRYGVIADRELTVLTETGRVLTYGRDGANTLWRQISPSAQQSERSRNAMAMLRIAEDLLMSGCYTAAKGSTAKF